MRKPTWLYFREGRRQRGSRATGPVGSAGVMATARTYDQRRLLFPRIASLGIEPSSEQLIGSLPQKQRVGGGSPKGHRSRTRFATFWRSNWARLGPDFGGRRLHTSDLGLVELLPTPVPHSSLQRPQSPIEKSTGIALLKPNEEPFGCLSGIDFQLDTNLWPDFSKEILSGPSKSGAFSSADIS